MKNKTQIKVGQTVTATFAWSENEKPTAKNFFTGRVKEVVKRSKYAVYVKLENLDRLIPIDRVSIA